VHTFTTEEFELLVADLLLYCGDGNIREITDTYGPTPHGGRCGGVIHAHLDSFKFSTSDFHDQEAYWTIFLPDAKASITLGHGRIALLSFPKLHLDPLLSQRYQIANRIQYSYDYFSGMSESRRHRDLEAQLGYEHLPSYGKVLAQIIADFRSFEPPGSVREIKVQAPLN
jgi:hypothetical protein